MLSLRLTKKNWKRQLSLPQRDGRDNHMITPTDPLVDFKQKNQPKKI